MRTLLPKLVHRRQWRPIPPTVDRFILSSSGDSGTVRSVLALVDIERDSTLTLYFSQELATVKVHLQVTPTGVRYVDPPDAPSFGDVSSFLDTFVDWFADPARRTSLLQLIARWHCPGRAHDEASTAPGILSADHLHRDRRVFLLANIGAGALPAEQTPLALAMVESGYDGSLEDLITVTATSRADR